MGKKYQIHWDNLIRVLLTLLAIGYTIHLSCHKKAQHKSFNAENSKREGILESQSRINALINEAFDKSSKDLNDFLGIPETLKHTLKTTKKTINYSMNKDITKEHPGDTPLFWENATYHSFNGFNIGFLDGDVHFYEITNEALLAELLKIQSMVKRGVQNRYRFPYSYMHYPPLDKKEMRSYIDSIKKD